MIVRDEERVLRRCLTSVQDLVEEIIVVDTGSLDKTKAIASECGAILYDFEWIDDFAAARNFAFSKATQDYILWLDADDVLLEEDCKAFKALKETLDSSIDMVIMKYNVAFDALGKPTFSYDRERLMKREKNFQWMGAVHEVIAYSGKLLYSDIAITHRKLGQNDPDRNLRIFEKIKENQELDARQQYYYARELYYHGRYQESIQQFLKFLDEPDAWLENKINACLDLALCYRAIQEEDKALTSLFRSFQYDHPRAELCCEIGKHFFNKQDYYNASYWYELATTCTMNPNSGGFVQVDCYGYLPWIQLCVCYDKMHNLQKAQQCNEKAGSYKPQDAAYLFNKQYFERQNIQNE